MSSIAVILAAAGQSSRFNHPSEKKTFVSLNAKAVWLHSVDWFLKRNDVKQVIVVVSPEDLEEFRGRFGPNIAVLDLDVVAGGKQRSDSIENALRRVEAQHEWVLIHDAARPCINSDLIESVVVAAKKHGAAIPAVPVHSTLKRSTDGKAVEATVDRDSLYLAQTPQVFRRTQLLEAFESRGDFQPTDESQLMERAGHRVALVPGSPLNIKITQRNDLRLAKACLEAMPTPRIDRPIHPFADDNFFR